MPQFRVDETGESIRTGEAFGSTHELFTRAEFYGVSYNNDDLARNSGADGDRVHLEVNLNEVNLRGNTLVELAIAADHTFTLTAPETVDTLRTWANAQATAQGITPPAADADQAALLQWAVENGQDLSTFISPAERQTAASYLHGQGVLLSATPDSFGDLAINPLNPVARMVLEDTILRVGQIPNVDGMALQLDTGPDSAFAAALVEQAVLVRDPATGVLTFANPLPSPNMFETAGITVTAGGSYLDAVRELDQALFATYQPTVATLRSQTPPTFATYFDGFHNAYLNDDGLTANADVLQFVQRPPVVVDGVVFYLGGAMDSQLMGHSDLASGEVVSHFDGVDGQAFLRSPYDARANALRTAQTFSQNWVTSLGADYYGAAWPVNPQAAYISAPVGAPATRMAEYAANFADANGFWNSYGFSDAELNNGGPVVPSSAIRQHAAEFVFRFDNIDPRLDAVWEETVTLSSLTATNPALNSLLGEIQNAVAGTEADGLVGAVLSQATVQAIANRDGNTVLSVGELGQIVAQLAASGDISITDATDVVNQAVENASTGAGVRTRTGGY